jgi:hypothetical protein
MDWLHGVISQDIELFITTGVPTSNPTLFLGSLQCNERIVSFCGRTIFAHPLDSSYPALDGERPTPDDYFFLIRILGDGVQTGSTRHVGYWMAYCICPGKLWEIGGMKIGRGNRSTQRKPAPAPLCPPQIPLDQNRVWTRAAAVGSQRLTAWAMARPTPDNEWSGSETILTAENISVHKLKKRNSIFIACNLENIEVYTLSLLHSEYLWSSCERNMFISDSVCTSYWLTDRGSIRSDQHSMPLFIATVVY